MKIVKRSISGPARASLNFNGDSGNNVFNGGGDNDTAVGNGGNDTLSGGDGNDLLVGNSGSDTLDGGAGNDTLYAGDESPPFSYPYYGNQFTPPLLDTGSEVDTLIGGAGDDVIFAGYGDNVDGGTSSVYGDVLQISFLGAPSGVTVDFTLASQTISGGTITGIENVGYVQGSNFDDDINVAGSSNGYSPFGAVYGMGGNDRLRAGYYTGTLFGGDGNDIVDGRGSQYLQLVDGGDGDDTLYTNSNTFGEARGGAGNDTIYSHGTTYGGSGNDLIILQFSYYGGVVYGEDGNDEIRASNAGNYLSGGAGADILTGDAGVDTLMAGNFLAPGTTPDYDMALDHDVLAGFGNNDLLSAGYGDDIDGGSGSDTLRYSFGGLASGITFDTIGFVSGQPFSVGGGTINSIETLSHLRGTNFADTLTLATQAQLLTVDAGDGDDTVTSTGSSVALNGGSGNDRLISGIAGDTFDGGAGTDTIDYRNAASGVIVQLGLAAGQAGTGAGGDSLVNVENIDGSAQGDGLYGSNDANVILGKGGADTLDGKGGNDILDGGTGADSMTGGLGDDVFYVDEIGDQLFETQNQGSDIAYASVTWSLAAGQHVETLVVADGAGALGLTGNELANTLIGNGAGNALNGGAGNDTLIGGAGADTMTGGADNDIYYVDDAGDSVVEAAGGGTRDVVYASLNYALASGQDIEVLAATAPGATSPLQLTGNGIANEIYGNAGDNLIDGGAGADYMQGFGGNDTYLVDHGGDLVIEAAGNGRDVVYASTSYTLAAGSSVEVLSVISQSGGTPIDLTGNNLANELYGNTDANFLDGGGAADYLAGFGGSDTYVVDNLGDIVAEGANEGRDVVYARADYVLTAGQEIEVLAAISQAATTALQLTGNEQRQEMYGNAGANFIDGAGGADFMQGFSGNDTYIVDNGSDYVFEAVGGGRDVIYAKTSFTLAAGTEVEVLSVISQSGGVAIDLTGNELANELYGNTDANFLDGGAGADYLQGFAGNDSYVVEVQGDVVVEAAGEGRDVVYARASYTLAANQSIEVLSAIQQSATTAIDLGGNNLDNELYGNQGANVLNGGLGADYLVGYGGADSFAFTTALGGGNVDQLADFLAGTDKVALDDAIFAGIGAPGAFNANAFVVGAQAGDADDRIVYNSATGQLFYDADGNGAGAAVLFATLTPGTVLAASDFTVI